MFNDVNKVTLMGNVTQDPDLRYTSGGTPVLNFSIATNRRYQQNDEWKDDTTYHNVVAWRSAEALGKRIKKGTRVYVEGRIQTSSWESNGEKKYKTEVNADVVNLIARYEDGDSQGGGSSSAPSNSGGKDETEINPDDLPF